LVFNEIIQKYRMFNNHVILVHAHNKFNKKNMNLNNWSYNFNRYCLWSVRYKFS